ncbi:transporter substrate-binding domain-containing protein [Pseudoduganella sp. LjRoot289]|uniref:substrate-binding periplasmic protein n=1 Tax=Pseudoduganella sp. LjRoot289 TaxID=3342314 RepID=UPI003ECC88A3
MRVLYGAALLFFASNALAGDAIVATYNDRPPYQQQTVGGAPSGLTGTPAVAAFQDAGIDVVWTQVPSNRQLAMVKDPAARSCALGWFRTPERERYAKFTKAIYRDKDWVLLARADFDAGEGITLEVLLQRPSTRVLVKDNYSYGAQIDEMMARLKPNLALSTGSPAQMLQSVSAGAVDFMFASQEEAQYLLGHGGEPAKNLRILKPRDMPRGGERYIMCGKGVPDEVIDRLNKAITFK